jgi:hypothetical protein
MKPQSIFDKYRKIYRFHSVYGRLEGIRRVCSIFKEMDYFDFKRSINTRTTKMQPLENKNYMPYVPVFYSVALEMIRTAHNYYSSAIRYSDLSRKTVFVDFGAGAAKSLIIANETEKFDLITGIEIDQELYNQAKKNIVKSSTGKTEMILGNIENKLTIDFFSSLCHLSDIHNSNSTIFVFNKNSYGPNVLRNSLVLLEQSWSSIIYLYQNPVHHEVLISLGYTFFAEDSKDSTTHKNYKYKLYLKHKFEN